MPKREIDDLLRREYFELLPEIRRAANHLKAEVTYHLLPIMRSLSQFERLEVRARVKECESAVDALHRRQDTPQFDRGRKGKYTLTALKDLAGVRVLAFPRSRLVEIDAVLRRVEALGKWTSDPVLDDRGNTLAFKYWGYCAGSTRVLGEYQIVSTLTGLFWEVEHSAIYKASPELRGVTRAPSMQERSRKVLKALTGFEKEFERLIRDSAVS